MNRSSPLPRPTFGLLEGLLGFPLRQVDLRWLNSLGERLSHLNITTGRAAALFFIESNPGCSQAQLGGALRINRPSTVRAVDDLAAIGAVERGKANGNARNNALTLTDIGRDLHRAVWEEVLEHEQAYFAPLAPAERETLRRLFRKILAAQAKQPPSDQVPAHPADDSAASPRARRPRRQVHAA